MMALIKRLALTAGAALAFPSLGCGVEFDSAAELEGLRVMAVQKSLPYAAPGDEVQLRMLYHDDAAEARDVNILWLGGCKNPPGDLYAVCVAVLNAAFEELDLPPLPEDSGDDVAALGAVAAEQGALLEQVGVTLGFGDSFSVTVDSDLIDGHPPPQTPGRPDYGLEHVFFAACAGRLWFSPPGSDFPIACYDDEGELVGPDSYVVGYTTIYAYEELANNNPVVEGIEVKLRDSWKKPEAGVVCVGAECASSEADTGGECSGDEPVVALCPDPDKPASCDTLDVRVVVDEASVDIDELLSREGEAPISEQMWVTYYADRGSLSNSLKLVNDLTAGFQRAVDTTYTPPEEPGRAYMWAVVRDGHGGTDWARIALCVE